jgi:hypothetical protein
MEFVISILPFGFLAETLLRKAPLSSICNRKLESRNNYSAKTCQGDDNRCMEIFSCQMVNPRPTFCLNHLS